MCPKLAFDQLRWIVRFRAHDSLSYTSGLAPYALYLQVQQFMASCAVGGTVGTKHWRPPYGTSKAVWPLNTVTNLILTEGWSSNSQTAYVTFQFNPSDLDPHATAQLLHVLDSILPGGYGFLVTRGRLSYIELRLDIVGAPFDRYFAIDTRLRRFSERYRDRGTSYIGGPAGDRELKLYDRRRRIMDGGGADLGHDLLRLEVVLRHRYFTLAELASLQNPFATVVVVDITKLPKLKGHGFVDQFRRDLTKGFRPQAAYLRSANRAALVEGLNKARPDWYDPTALGAQLPALAATLAPAAMQTCAGIPQSAGPSVPPIH